MFPASRNELRHGQTSEVKVIEYSIGMEAGGMRWLECEIETRTERTSQVKEGTTRVNPEQEMIVRREVEKVGKHTQGGEVITVSSLTGTIF
jgi:hypothetical protein